MIWWILVIVFLGLLIALALWAPIVVQVVFTRQSGDDEGLLSVRYGYGLFRWQRRLTHVQATGLPGGPVLKVRSHTEGKPKSQQKVVQKITVDEMLSALTHWQDWFRFLQQGLPIMRSFFRHVRFDKFHLHLCLGTGEVITSGVACGTTSAVLNTVIGYLTYVSKFTIEPDVQVAADFQRSIFNTSVDCIFRVRAGYAIKATFRLFRVWKRRPSYGTPHSGTHADSHGEYS